MCDVRTNSNIMCIKSYIKFEQRSIGDAWSSMDRHQMARDRTMRTLEVYRLPLDVRRGKIQRSVFCTVRSEPVT
jgi:hypothetical protein